MFKPHRFKTSVMACALAAGFLLPNGIQAQTQPACVNPGDYYTESFAAPVGLSPWVYTNPGNKVIGNTGNGQMLVGAPNGCHFLSVIAGVSNRTCKQIPTTQLDDNNWTADFVFTLDPDPAGGRASNSPGHYLCAFTNGNLEPYISSGANTGNGACPTSTYSSSSANVIWATLTAPAPTSNTSNPFNKGGWVFEAGAEAGAGGLNSSATIPYPTTAGPGTSLYIRLQRTWSGSGMMSIYSDAAMTAEIPGSPVCFAIPSGVTGLKYFEAGVVPQGTCQRCLNATVSNLKVTNTLPCMVTINPAFNITSGVCVGTPIIVDGSASKMYPVPASSNLQDYIWNIIEVDANGVAIPGNTWSHSGPGMPGVYTFPYGFAGGPTFIQCGHHYVITLVIQSCGNSYVAAYQNLNPACATVISAPAQAGCAGMSVPITASGAVSYSWSPATYLDNTTGATVNCTPPATGSTTPTSYTYTVTGTDVNGCQAKTTTTVTAAPDNLNINLSTGQLDATGVAIAIGQRDDTWMITGNSAGPVLPTPAYCVAPVQNTWVAPAPNTDWISTAMNSDFTTPEQLHTTYNIHGIPPPSGNYYSYQTQFYLPVAYNNLSLNIQDVASDNQLSLYFNKIDWTLPANNPYNLYQVSGTCFDFLRTPGIVPTSAATYNVGVGVAGLNTVTVELDNGGGDGANGNYSYSGFTLKASLTGTCANQGTGCPTCRLEPKSGTSASTDPVRNPVIFYPNPTNGLLHVENYCPDRNCITDIRVMNMLGQIVYEKQGVSDKDLTIDLTDQPKGVYFIILKSDGEEEKSKVIKF